MKKQHKSKVHLKKLTIARINSHTMIKIKGGTSIETDTELSMDAIQCPHVV